MKITKAKLKQIIKEELEKMNEKWAVIGYADGGSHILYTANSKIECEKWVADKVTNQDDRFLDSVESGYEIDLLPS